MDYKEHFKYCAELDSKMVPEEAPSGWIQWKGTNICIDIHCKCGYHSHFDGSFMYYFKCPNCQILYAPQQTIAMHELPKEHVDFVKKHSPNVIQTVDLEPGEVPLVEPEKEEEELSKDPSVIVTECSFVATGYLLENKPFYAFEMGGTTIVEKEES